MESSIRNLTLPYQNLLENRPYLCWVRRVLFYVRGQDILVVSCDIFCDLLVKEKGLDVSFCDNVRRWHDGGMPTLICCEMDVGH